MVSCFSGSGRFRNLGCSQGLGQIWLMRDFWKPKKIRLMRSPWGGTDTEAWCWPQLTGGTGRGPGGGGAGPGGDPLGPTLTPVVSSELTGYFSQEKLRQLDAISLIHCTA